MSIEQKTTNRSPRSTVGTITEIYDYLRVLYSSVGVPYCPNCGIEISRQSTEQILQQILALPQGERIMILAPVVRGRKGEYKKDLEKLSRQGFEQIDEHDDDSGSDQRGGGEEHRPFHDRREQDQKRPAREPDQNGVADVRADGRQGLAFKAHTSVLLPGDGVAPAVCAPL